jgi:hypothetical protein
MNRDDVGTRRENLQALLGAIGGAAGLAALGGCAPDAADKGNVEARAGDLSGTTNIQWVDTAANLRALAGTANAVAILEGYTKPNDGGGGVFVWSTTGALDDGGTFLNAFGLSNSRAGWRRIYSGPLNIRWFGAHPTLTALANTTAIKLAFISAVVAGGGTVYVPAGNYLFGDDLSPLLLNEHISLVGDGIASILTYVGSGVALYWQPHKGTGVEMLSVIADLQITTNNSASKVAVYMTDTYRAVMRNVFIQGNGAGGFSQAGIVMQGQVPIDIEQDNVAFCHIEECSIILCGGDGIQLLGQIFACTAVRSQFSNNGFWAVHSPADQALVNGFSVVDCDLEGNGYGGISGTFHHARFVGNYFEPNGASTSCVFLSVHFTPTHPLTDPPQYGRALEISGNRIAGWIGPYAVDVSCSGLIGLSMCNNFFAANVPARGNVAGASFQGVTGLLLRGNDFESPPGIEVLGTYHANDLGLDVRVYRFALASLPSNQSTALPLDSAQARFTAIPMPHAGYVLGATVMLSQAPSAGSSVDVQVQRNQSLVGHLDTGPITASTFDTATPSLGGTLAIADKLAVGDLLGVVATANGAIGAPDIFVDVAVGFGDIGTAIF